MQHCALDEQANNSATLRPPLTFIIMFVHESREGKEEHKKVWRMRGKHKRFSFCWVRAPLFFRTAMMTERESLFNLSHFHVASGSMEKQFDVEQSVPFFPLRRLCKTIDVLQNRSTPTRHAVCHDTLLADRRVWVGFIAVQPFTILSLTSSSRHSCMQTVKELTERRTLRKSAHMSMWFWLNPAENSRIWEFHGRVGCKIPHMGQIQPTEAKRSG